LFMRIFEDSDICKCRKPDHETLAAVGAFIGFSIILSTITNFLVLPSAVWVVCLFTVAVTAVYTCITWFILDRNLNLG
ncbi:MAG: hypothetical protein Q4C20_11945, partial [Erysipelotrichaceae bacterium]|nr:hypothetical protein [Erysipelotrichaceae bacterium]